jgi:acyl-CoA synthetase (AMP-forming)/AMP-acid ligase II
VIVAAERPRGSGAGAADHLAAAIRRAVAERHDLSVGDIVWVRPGRLPRTGSGKPQRRACRAAYLAGELDGVGTAS